jgi:hypothetical protein
MFQGLRSVREISVSEIIDTEIVRSSTLSRLGVRIQGEIKS